MATSPETDTQARFRAKILNICTNSAAQEPAESADFNSCFPRAFSNIAGRHVTKLCKNQVPHEM
jgi:hypothetical protein